MEFCLEKVCEESKILFDSGKFINLKAPLLEVLLKRDYLNVDEIEIWEILLKWCFAQQNMKNDPANWNKEDITKIERSLHRFIPLIRFYDIKPTDFFYKVYCYKDILPHDLIHDLLEFHIVPDMKPKTNIAPTRKPNLKFKLDSTIIKSDHIPLFSSWIDKKGSSHYNKKNIPYEFKLLHCSSRDGFSAESFHRNCDGKGATIWIAKVQGSTQLVGGYSPLDWGGNDGWKSTADSFLFNFTDGNNISTSELSYSNNSGYSVYCNNERGSYTYDLYSESNTWGYNSSNYGPKIGIPSNFTAEYYEVFQVIKQIS